jgi:5'-3' exonuclease
LWSLWAIFTGRLDFWTRKNTGAVWLLSKPVFAIDASIYIFRSYFALQANWRSRDGSNTEAVYGFASFLLKLLQREKPTWIVAAFDESLGTGFRHQLYPPYKANRALPDENLAYQLAACRQLAEVLGITTLADSRYEADDFLAACAALAEPGQVVYLISADKDLSQLLSEQVQLWDYGRKAPIDSHQFIDTSGIAPELMTDLLALTGDASDNIPGVPGVGPKTATAILQTLGGVRHWLHDLTLLKTVPVRGAASLPRKIAPFVKQIELARQLVALQANIPGGPGKAALKRQPLDTAKAEALFQYWGIGALSKQLGRVKI